MASTKSSRARPASAGKEITKDSSVDDPGIAKLRELVRILEASSLAELKFEDANIIVELRRHSTSPSLPVVVPSATAASMPGAPATIAEFKTTPGAAPAKDADSGADI